MKNYDAIDLSRKVIEKLKTHWIASRTFTATGSKKPFIISLFFIACITFAFNRLVGPEEKIPSLLEQFGQKYPQEKVHLHVDRNYFATGDTLRFKAYVVNAENNQFSDLSKILYIDLLNVKDSGTVAFRFPITEGTASGFIELPDSLKAGTYALRAYTNWMRNFDQDFFYNATLKIGKSYQQKETTTQSNQNLHNIIFFPEGGDLVNDLTSTVAFKAINGAGMGENVSGIITDESGKDLVNFQSAFAGMGRFTLKPLAGKHYTAVVKFKDGATNKIALPTALASGYVLAVDNQDKTNVNVQVSFTGPPAAEPVWLVTQANNKLISLTKILFSNGTSNLLLSRRKLPTGIIQFTIFDKQSQPRAERLIFSDKHDQLHLNLGLQKPYTQHGALKVSMEVTDHLANPVSAGFSVAVVNKSSTTTDSTAMMQSILAHLLLTSDLKGNIENPDYYFRDRSPTTALRLDNLMLTQGWRRFTWQALITGKFPQIIYPVEKKQTLSGQAKTAKGIPLPGQDLLLVSKGDSAFTLHTLTDNNGRFTFELPNIEGKQQLSIVTSASQAGKAINIVPDQFAPANLGVLSLTGAQVTDLSRLLSGNLAAKQPLAPSPAQSANNQTRQLKEVIVKSKKMSLVEKAVAPSENLNGAGNANQIVTYKDLMHCSTLENCLMGKLVGVYFKTVKDPNSHNYIKVPYSTSGLNKPMLFVLDGVPMQSGQISLSSIPITDVQSIEVLRSGGLLAAYGLAGSGGVLVITTKKGGLDYNATNEQENGHSTSMPGVVTFTYNGYQKHREFYVPMYTAPDTKSIISPETIFWNPAIQTNDEGKALIEFPVGSNIKKFAVVIEGISADGKIASKYQEFINN